MTRKVVFISNDGWQFDTEEECKEYEAVFDLATKIQEHCIAYVPASTQTYMFHAAKWIMTNFTLTPKN